MTEKPEGAESSPNAETRLRHLAEIIAFACGLGCFLPAVVPKIWALLLNDAVALVAPLVVFSALAGTLFSAFARWRELPPESVRGLSSGIGARAGVIVLMVGGGVSVVAATLNQIGIRLPFATIPSPGFTILVVALSALPVVFAGSIASLLVSNIQVPRPSFPPQSTQSSKPTAETQTPSHQTKLFRYAVIFSVFCFLSPFVIPFFQDEKGTPVISKPSRKAEPEAPPFEYEKPEGFDHAPPSRWKVVAQKVISDLDQVRPVTISPDGSHLAYFPIGPAVSGIRVIDLDRFSPVADFKDSFVSPIAWSPDSNQLFFMTESGERTGLVLRIGTPEPIRLPIPAGNHLPDAQPYWWSEDEIAFFPDGEEAAWLDLNSLRISSIKSSPTWRKRVKSGKSTSPPTVKMKPPETSRCSLAIGDPISAFESPRFRQDEWETEGYPSFFIRDRLHSHLRVLPGLPYSRGERILTTKNGTKLILLAGSVARIYYLGLNPRTTPVWSVQEMPLKPDAFSKSESEAGKHLKNQTFCTFVCAPLVNPLNGKVVGPNRKHVKGLARILSWEGQKAAIWIAEEYIPIEEGDVISDLHVWKDATPTYLGEFAPENWWATVTQPSEEQSKLTISSNAGSIDRKFALELSQDDDGFYIADLPATDPKPKPKPDPKPKGLTANEIVSTPRSAVPIVESDGAMTLRQEPIVSPQFQSGRNTDVSRNSADDQEKREMKKQITDLLDQRAELQKSLAKLNSIRIPTVTGDDIRRFVTAHHQKATRKDLNGFVSDYGDKIDYYDKGVVDRAFIRRDQGDYFAKYVGLAEAIDGTIQVEKSEPTRYEASYPLALAIVRTDGKRQVKLVRVTMEIDVSSGSAKIISEDSRVIQSSGKPK